MLGPLASVWLICFAATAPRSTNKEVQTQITDAASVIVLPFLLLIHLFYSYQINKQINK